MPHMVLEDDAGLQQVMIRNMREKFGPRGAAIIVGAIAIVFVFFGVYTPDGGMGGQPGVAGTVNGEPIMEQDLQRELARRMEFFKNLNISAEQLKMLRLEDTVFQDMAGRMLLVQEADKRGLVPSKDEIKAKVSSFPAFQKDGAFNRDVYEQALNNAQISPAQFERMIRQEIVGERWQAMIKSLVLVSDSDWQQEWQVSKDRRSVRYVLITPEMAQKAVQVPQAEIDALLKDPEQKALIARRFDAGKQFLYKGKTLANVERQIARDIVASKRTDAVTSETKRLALAVQKVLTKDKSSDKAIKALLKDIGGDVRDTGPFNRKTPFIPGLGEAKELMRDAFAKNLSQPKNFQIAAGTVVAVAGLVEVAPPFPTEETKQDGKPAPKQVSKLFEEAKKVRSEIETNREREIFSAFMKRLQDKAKIVRSTTAEG